MVTTDPVLQFDHVSFAYDGRTILGDVSFAVRSGEIVALLGPSGCGKTTILNIVAGFLQPIAAPLSSTTARFPARAPIAAWSFRPRRYSTG